MKYITGLLFFLGSGLIISCATSLYLPTDAQVAWVNNTYQTSATLADLETGKTLYAENCVKCHNLYEPAAFSIGEWKEIIPGMAKNAELSAKNTLLVQYYLTAGAKDSGN